MYREHSPRRLMRPMGPRIREDDNLLSFPWQWESMEKLRHQEVLYAPVLSFARFAASRESISAHRLRCFSRSSPCVPCAPRETRIPSHRLRLVDELMGPRMREDDDLAPWVPAFARTTTDNLLSFPWQWESNLRFSVSRLSSPVFRLSSPVSRLSSPALICAFRWRFHRFRHFFARF